MLAWLRKPAAKLFIFLLSTVAQEALVRSWDAWRERSAFVSTANEPGELHQPGIESRLKEPDPTPVPRVLPAATRVPASPPPLLEPAWDVNPGKEFDVFVLSQEYRWELGSVLIKNPGDEMADMDGKLDLLLEQCGRNYQGLIAVGTASCEGDEEEELDRAGDRSHELIRLTRDALTRIKDTVPRHLYRLNLGRFRTCDGSVRGKTDDQRRVILVAVKQSRPNVNRVELERALRDELDDPVRLPLGFRMGDYLSFELREAR